MAKAFEKVMGFLKKHSWIFAFANFAVLALPALYYAMVSLVKLLGPYWWVIITLLVPFLTGVLFTIVAVRESRRKRREKTEKDSEKLINAFVAGLTQATTDFKAQVEENKKHHIEETEKAVGALKSDLNEKQQELQDSIRSIASHLANTQRTVDLFAHLDPEDMKRKVTKHHGDLSALQTQVDHLIGKLPDIRDLGTKMIEISERMGEIFTRLREVEGAIEHIRTTGTGGFDKTTQYLESRDRQLLKAINDLRGAQGLDPIQPDQIG